MNKYKKLAFNTLVFTIGSFSSKILSFLLARLYANTLSTSDYSTVNLITQTANLLIPIATLSITEGVIRFGLDKDFDKKQIYTVGFLTTCVGLAVLGILSPFINMVPTITGYTLLLMIYMVTSSFRMLNQYFVRARGLVKLFSADGIITTFVMLILNILFLLVFKWGITGYIMSIILSDALSSVFLCAVADNMKYIQIKGLERSVVSSMVRYSIPMIPTYILWWIVGLSDQYFIVFMIDDDANGLYSMAHKIPSLINIVSTIFFQAWQMSAITEYQSEGARNFYTKVFDAYQSMMVIASAGILMFVKPIMSLLTGGTDFYEGYVYVPLLLIGVVFCCFCQFLSSIYSATKNTKNSLWTSLIAALVNVLLNIVFIPRIGVQGACLSMVCGYGACFIVRIIDTRRYIKFHFNVVKFVINMSLLAMMGFTIILDYSHLVVWLVSGFALVVLYNYSSILETLKQIIGKKKKA
jgi:O-antigen/teichoic acid export membrane protein